MEASAAARAIIGDWESRALSSVSLVIDDTTEITHFSVKPKRRIVEDSPEASPGADGQLQRAATKAEAEAQRPGGAHFDFQPASQVVLARAESAPLRPKSALPKLAAPPERAAYAGSVPGTAVVRMDALALDTAEAWERSALGRAEPARRGAAPAPGRFAGRGVPRAGAGRPGSAPGTLRAFAKGRRGTPSSIMLQGATAELQARAH